VGTLGALGALLALVARDRFGSGQLVEVPENEALLSLLSLPTTVFAYLGRDDVRLGDRHPFGIYPCADGHLGVNILTQRHWEGLCHMMQRPDLVDDPRFADGDRRATPEAVAAIDELIRAWVADKAAQTTFDAGQALRVPIAIVPSPRQVLDSAQYAARGYWHDYVDSVLGPLRVPGPPYRASPGTFAPFREAAPRGSSTASVLDELALDAAARLALAGLGVVGR
jgi:formyl-CoA transferase